MNDIMVDIETLDTKESAAILSVGACIFNFEEGWISDDIYSVTCRLVDQVTHGRTMSIPTIKWWLEQKFKAVEVTWTEEAELREALYGLKHFIPTGCPVWSNGPSFDIAILDHAYKSFDMEPRWIYKDLRDCRTMYDMNKRLGYEVDDLTLGIDVIKHSANYDVQNQAYHMIQIYKNLKEGGK